MTATAVKSMVKKIVQEMLEKSEKNLGKRLQVVSPPAASSNVDLMKELLEHGMEDDQILVVFCRRYAIQGKTDDEWVEKRVRAYKRLALKDPKVKRAYRRRAEAA